MKKEVFGFLTILCLMQFQFHLISQDFEVSPVKLYFNAEPGQTQNIPVRVINHSNIKTAFVVSLGDFVANKEGVLAPMKASTTEHSLANWISINPPFIEINPNEEQQVMVSIQAPSGDYSTKWANIYITSSKEQTALEADKAKQAALALSAQILVRVFQSPNSNNNYKLKIGGLAEIPNDKDSSRVFTATVDNIGDKITKCKVILIASDLSTAKETKLDEITFESYPDAQLNIKLKMNKTLPSGKYSLAAILDYGSKQNLEGTQMLLEIP
jgi:hypothetical protein